MRQVLILIAFGILAVSFLILASFVSLGIRLTGRRGRARSVFKWFSISFVVVAPTVVFVVFPLVMAHQITRFGTRPRDRAQEETPASYGCDFKSVSFPSRDGIPLSGWWMPGRNDLPVFVITHGLFRDRKEVTERGCRLNQQGYGSLVFDLRHHGASGGTSTSLGYLERLDVEGAYDFTRADSSMGVILMGVSMGATACILALEETGPDVVGIVADSPFLSLKETVDRHVRIFLGLPAFPFSNLFRWELTRIDGFDGDKLDCRRAFSADRPVPVLLIYGQNDRRMPAQTAKAVFEAIPYSAKELEFFPGATHGAAWRTDPERYTALVLGFVKKDVMTRAGQ